MWIDFALLRRAFDRAFDDFRDFDYGTNVTCLNNIYHNISELLFRNAVRTNSFVQCAGIKRRKDVGPDDHNRLPFGPSTWNGWSKRLSLGDMWLRE